MLFTPVSITTLIGTEDAHCILKGISPIAKGDLKWLDALLVTGTVNSNRVDKERVLQENNCLQRLSLCASISITELCSYCA